jgi:hypothetical protein
MTFKQSTAPLALKEMSSLRYYSLALGGMAVAAVSVGYWLRGGKKSSEQKELERRIRISRGGRITDGTVMDVHEMDGEDKEPIQLLIYTYDVAGVSYEASQDVTLLRQFIDFHSCRLGLPTSIKYDPQNPGNSIVISEEWSGLRR